MFEREASLRQRIEERSRAGALLPSFRIGRSTHSHLVLPEDHVSGEHAIINHAGGDDWCVRDLGSKNGTFLNRRRLAAGDVKLVDGDVLGFGDERSAWVFSAGRPSALLAVPVGQLDWSHVPENEHLLALPSPERPDAALLLRGGRWLLEMPGLDTLPVSDGQTLQVSGREYRIWLSSATARTRDAAQHPRRLSEVVLRLAVSRDEEEIEAELQVSSARISMPARVYLYMLVLLGRYHHEDAALGLPSSETGWRYASEVARALKVEQGAMNILIHRARQDMAKLGFEDPAALIERRAMTRQIRLGISADRVTFAAL